MTALLRVHTLYDLLLSVPMRWLTGCEAKLEDWSPYSMGKVRCRESNSGPPNPYLNAHISLRIWARVQFIIAGAGLG